LVDQTTDIADLQVKQNIEQEQLKEILRDQAVIKHELSEDAQDKLYHSNQEQHPSIF